MGSGCSKWCKACCCGEPEDYECNNGAANGRKGGRSAEAGVVVDGKVCKVHECMMDHEGFDDDGNNWSDFPPTEHHHYHVNPCHKGCGNKAFYTSFGGNATFSREGNINGAMRSSVPVCPVHGRLMTKVYENNNNGNNSSKNC